ARFAQRQLTLVTPGKPGPGRPPASTAEHVPMLGTPTDKSGSIKHRMDMVDRRPQRSVVSGPPCAALPHDSARCHDKCHSMHMDGSVLPIIDRRAYREWLALLSVQHGIIDRGQALRAGFTRRQVEYRLSSAAWQSVHPGVYATFSGPLSREARLWAAIRLVGEGAMVSHQTAAEVHGIIDKPVGIAIHVTVPPHRRPVRRNPPRGLVIHRSDQSQAQFVGPFNLPRTRVEDTVLDLVAAASTFDQAYSWISRAVSRKLVTVNGLQAALDSRHRVRWRNWLNEALAD